MGAGGATAAAGIAADGAAACAAVAVALCDALLPAMPSGERMPGASTNTCVACDGSSPWAREVSTKSMYGPGGATDPVGGVATVTESWVCLSTGSSIIR